MTQTSWTGIYPSLATPFAESGGIDLEAQRAITRFALEGGAHGLICFGLAGEVFRLTPQERIELLEVIVDEVDGRIPVLAGVGTESEYHSVRLARAAAGAGATGIVIPPPLTCPSASAPLLRYFERIAGDVELPVMIQDAPEYLRVEVGPELVATLAQRAPNLAAVKLEVGPDGLGRWAVEFAGRLAIFGGNGGLYLIDCLDHGASGIAPGVDTVDVLVEIHSLWSADRPDEAWERMRLLLPLLTFQMQTIDHYNATAKYVLQQRGVISGAEMRAPAVGLDDVSRGILDRYLKTLRLVAV
jgi:dihydrodipicolinate synthase/N-acetylneuraminate lyase